MTDCLFCNSKDVTSEHQAKCHTDLVRALATDLLLFGIRAAKKITNENGSLIGVRHVNPMRLRYDRETESYHVQPRSLQPLSTAHGTILTTRSRYHHQKVSMNEREKSVRKAANSKMTRRDAVEQLLNSPESATGEIQERGPGCDVKRKGRSRGDANKRQGGGGAARGETDRGG